MSETILLKDQHQIKDGVNNDFISHAFHAGPKKTVINIVDHDTQEVLQTVHNKILVPGSQDTACKQFGLERLVEFPNYNDALGLENSLDLETIVPLNEPITCLWCCGQSGYLSSPNEVLAVSNTDRVEPVDDLIPFRYVDPVDDLDYDQRQKYFGRKVMDNNMIAYYFKAFDTEPQLHIRYLDGTQVSERMYEIDSSQQVEVYIEMKLSANRLDFRDYMDRVLGWDKGYINTVSLLTAWYKNYPINPELPEDTPPFYKYYQNIIPFTKFNFRNEDLSNLSRAVDFVYHVYY